MLLSKSPRSRTSRRKERYARLFVYTISWCSPRFAALRRLFRLSSARLIKCARREANGNSLPTRAFPEINPEAQKQKSWKASAVKIFNSSTWLLPGRLQIFWTKLWTLFEGNAWYFLVCRKKSFPSNESDTKIVQCISFVYEVGIISSNSDWINIFPCRVAVSYCANGIEVM